MTHTTHTKKTARTIFVMLAAIAASTCAHAVNVWSIDADANVVRPPANVRSYGHGETVYIAPLLMDSGVPRDFSTNTTFVFFWKIPGATNYWASTNVVYPVSHNVSVASNGFTVGTEIITYTNINYGTNIVTWAVTNSVTNWFTAYANVSVTDTGRVWCRWDGTMDPGAPSYTWQVGEFQGSDVTYRVSGTLNMIDSPGFVPAMAMNQWCWTNALSKYYPTWSDVSNMVRVSFPTNIMYAIPAGGGRYHIQVGP